MTSMQLKCARYSTSWAHVIEDPKKKKKSGNKQMPTLRGTDSDCHCMLEKKAYTVESVAVSSRKLPSSTTTPLQQTSPLLWIILTVYLCGLFCSPP